MGCRVERDRGSRETGQIATQPRIETCEQVDDRETRKHHHQRVGRQAIARCGPGYSAQSAAELSVKIEGRRTGFCAKKGRLHFVSEGTTTTETARKRCVGK